MVRGDSPTPLSKANSLYVKTTKNITVKLCYYLMKFPLKQMLPIEDNL